MYAADDLRLASYLDERFSAAAQPTDEEIRQAGESARQRLTDERRRALIGAWTAELRRRADVTVLVRKWKVSRTFDSPLSLSTCEKHKNLRRIESTVAHYRRHDAAARDVNPAPERAEHRRRQHRVPSLQAVAEAEDQAVQNQAHVRAAEILLEAVKDERALDFFAQAAADRRDDREKKACAGD